MPSYSYIAVDAMGKEKKATIDAENQNKAAAQLNLISFSNIPTSFMDIKVSPFFLSWAAALF